MPMEDTRRRSRWMLRAQEWDDARARYPNVWHEGMPCRLLAFETVAGRLRLGDLIAVYSPASQKHSERSDRFVGLSRVTAVARAHDPAMAWVELETAHRFDPPLDLGKAPRRVFLCCDAGWPEGEVSLFQRVFDAAVTAGWRPVPEEAAEPRSPKPPEERPDRPPEAVSPVDAAPPEGEPRLREERAETRVVADTARLFGGADFSGDMRDPRTGTWFAAVALHEGALEVVRLEPTGRTGLQDLLQDSDAALLRVEAIGLDFPFGVPVAFAEHLLGGPFPEEGWRALARRFERLSRPDYLVALQEFRDEHGELKRLTDEIAGGFSPLHRINPDLGPMTYHGIRLIAEERSRHVVRPFETAKGRLLLEVYPGGVVRKLNLKGEETAEGGRRSAIVAALERLDPWPVRVGDPFRRRCLESRDALDAVIAARCAAAAVLGGETERAPDELAPGEAERVLREGWIYGTPA